MICVIIMKARKIKMIQKMTFNIHNLMVCILCNVCSIIMIYDIFIIIILIHFQKKGRLPVQVLNPVRKYRYVIFRMYP